MRRNEKIERAQGLAGRFERGPNVCVMQSGFHGKFDDPKKTQKSFEQASLLRMVPEVFLHSGPEFRGNDDRDASEGRVR